VIEHTEGSCPPTVAGNTEIKRGYTEKNLVKCIVCVKLQCKPMYVLYVHGAKRFASLLHTFYFIRVTPSATQNLQKTTSFSFF